MEIDPLSWPRLTGKFWYDLPHYWEMFSTDDSLEIVPAKTPRGLIIGLVVLGLLVLTGVGTFLLWQPGFPDKGWLLVGGIGLSLVFIVAVPALIHIKYYIEQARGPILSISFVDKEVHLHRENRSWPFDNIVRWEIVRGAWVRGEGKHKEPHLFDDISELQMIVKNDAGNESAWPVVGGSTNVSFRTAAGEIAKKMNLPLVMLRDKTRGIGSIAIGPKEYGLE
jgi:hypothetical protein